jgi:hypothetical protein
MRGWAAFASNWILNIVFYSNMQDVVVGM